MERAVFQALGGFNELMVDWGFEDTDLAGRLELAGFRRIELRGVDDLTQENARELRVQHFQVKHPEFTWKRKTVKLDPGSLLLIYTDGLTEAQNLTGGFFEDERVMHVVRDNLHQPIEGLCNAILASVYDFAGDAPRSDDITLMLIRREVSPGSKAPGS